MASAEVASALSASPPNRTPRRDPLPAHLVAIGTVGLLVLLLATRWDSLLVVPIDWPSLSFWTLLVIVVNLVPVAVEGLRLTLDLPILLAVALLYPPEIAAAVAFIGTTDARELAQGGLGLSGALFNRAQVSVSVFLASLTYWSVASALAPLHVALLGTLAAVSADYAANVVLVSAHLAGKGLSRFWGAMRELTIGRARGILATYLGYGVLALVLAHLYERVGAWSVVAFLVPILVARAMLMRGQELEQAAEQLKLQKEQLERALERLSEERSDERARVAGELHDEVLQSLTKVSMLVRLIAKNVSAGLAIDPDVHELVSVSEGSIRSLRRIMRDLYESPLGRHGLMGSLRRLRRDLQLGHRTSLELEMPDTLELPEETQLVIYQIAREALTNALKHANAKRVHLSLRARGGNGLLIVEDDGRGFDVESVNKSHHFGLMLVTHRAHRIGGRLRLLSAANKGTRLCLEFPAAGTPTKAPGPDVTLLP